MAGNRTTRRLQLTSIGRVSNSVLISQGGSFKVRDLVESGRGRVTEAPRNRGKHWQKLVNQGPDALLETMRPTVGAMMVAAIVVALKTADQLAKHHG